MCFLLVFACAQRSKAEPIATDTEDRGLAVCSGYDAAHDRWGPWGKKPDEDGEDDCPADQAFLAHSYVSGSRWRPINTFEIAGYCCKIPNGVLLNEHMFVSEECPDDYVVTGGRVENVSAVSGNDTHQSQRYLLRCTRIDRTKYTLGPSTRGWQVTLVQDFVDQVVHWLRFGVPERTTTRSRIPMALRYGLFRVGPTRWDEDGCIGYPWGSILTGRTNKHCAGHIFRELLYRGTSSATSVPVKMYPDCIALSSPFDVNPSCIPAKTKPTKENTVP